MKSPRALILVAGLATLCASGEIFAQTFATGQAARLVIGQNTFTTANYGATNQLIGAPSGIALANGILWVDDANRLGALPTNNRVLRFNDVATYPTPTQDPTFPGSLCSVCRGTASLVLGQPDFVTADVALTATGMRNPTGVASDGTILAVADTDNNRILIWHTLPTSNGQPADTVIGQPDFTHNGTSVPPTATSLRGPTGLWMAGGKLYVADTQDNRILIYNKIPTTNNVAADVVIGQPNFTSFVQPDLTQTAGTAANNLQTPVGVSTDGQRMFVADLGQNRILIWNKIPTTNGVAADVAIGQPDLVSNIANNAANTTGDTLDADNNPIGATPVLCQSNGVDATTGTAYFPLRCASTLSFPRYAVSDGTRLFVADGGNDRVLVFNTIPTVSGQRADTIIGQPDEFSDNTGENPDGTNTFQSPTALVWDAPNQNLYVSDTYNRRILVFSPGPLNLPLNGVVNAASLNVAAIGSVLIQGSISAKDTITVTIAGKGYTYTILATDTTLTVAQGLAKLINAAPDPNVLATVDTDTSTLVLTARQPGPAGGAITLATTISNGAQISPVASGSTLSLNLENPSSIAPGTLVQISGQNLCDNIETASFSGEYLPFNLQGCEVFVDGNRMPLLYTSPTQINAQMPVFFLDRTSVSMYVRMTHADGSITVTAPIAVTVVPQNPGIFAGGGADPRPGYVFHYSNLAQNVLQVGGTPNTGDVLTATIGTNTYTYTVTSTDTLSSIQLNLISLINGTPDPNVTASFANTNNNIILTAMPGTDQNGLAITTAVTGTNNTTLLTATNSTMCCEYAAYDTISIGGAIQAGDVATINIGPNVYGYVVTSSDTLATIQSNLVGEINAFPDPNVNVLVASTTTSSTNTNIIVYAKQQGPAGEGIPIGVSVGGTSPMLTLSTEYPSTCCDTAANAQVTVNSPAQPGEFVYVLSTGLGPTSTQDQATGQIFTGGSADPPIVPVDSILTGSFAATIVSAQLVPGTVGVYNVVMQLSSSATTDAQSQTTIAQQTFVSNVVTLPIQEPGYPFSADVLAAAAGNARRKMLQAPAPR